MFALLSALCAGLAAWLWLSPTTPAGRLARLRPADPRPRGHAEGPLAWHAHAAGETEEPPAWLGPSRNRPRRMTRKTAVTAACAGPMTTLLFGVGPIGVVAGLLTATAVAVFLHRREPQQVRQERERMAADLPFAADLMTACLIAGRPVSAATEIAGRTVGGPLGRRLGWVSSRLRLGADPETTWAALAGDPAMGGLCRAMGRAAQSGAPVAEVLTRLADDALEATRAGSVASARQVGVKAVAPLGLCFLPAFVLLGIIPVVAGLASTIVLP
ncbi:MULTISPECIES: type II secretion system F family protein [unclassified Nonomuraea]|uniref:type II secretion system F family protein n=1 Tax=unclassified Nonomuraea TaxID=2593643 RepID=UPI001F2783E1|nr:MULTISPECIES: type II secretion system F family protein [unclassified Nonomuraea]